MEEGALEAFHGTIIHSISPAEIELVENGFLVISTPDTGGRIIVFEKNLAPSRIESVLFKELGIEASSIAISDAGQTRSGSSSTPSTTHAPTKSIPKIHVHRLKPTQFIIPGFIDTHHHAPQYTQRGLGRGIPLLSWLQDVTFPHEARFEDPKYAQRTYTSLVNSMLRQGITTASYYGSLHGPATQILASICLAKGQRALIGKCNMDSHNSPEFYRDSSCAESLAQTKSLIQHIRQLDPSANLIQPILTPRFAISCTPGLLSGLGSLALSDPSLMIQTHFNEAPDEIAYTRQLFPDFATETDLYSHYNLLTSNTILAHTIFNTESEIQRLIDINIGIAHCPISNTTIPTFMAAPIRRFLSQGLLKIGLGTDSGGGYSSSILDTARLAYIVSNARQTYHEVGNEYKKFRPGPPWNDDDDDDDDHDFSCSATSPSTQEQDQEQEQERETPLTLPECFYLSTLGGARVCNLDSKTGNFQKDKEFDALLIDMPSCCVLDQNESDATSAAAAAAAAAAVATSNNDRDGYNYTSTPIEPEIDTPKEIFEKFLMTGDDRNIFGVWVRGRRVK
ncbi:putative guanine deaminase [Phaeomoniella chlamydospora]|uniref:Putative guanine deaminase n=1 Tax=Phaeomoniella chlamydospora TaxID=158046 RepID=A0A0G2GIS8_PHACM|nr:putative guanine deaminase [Phaeomoniella chlamydospora]